MGLLTNALFSPVLAPYIVPTVSSGIRNIQKASSNYPSIYLMPLSMLANKTSPPAEFDQIMLSALREAASKFGINPNMIAISREQVNLWGKILMQPKVDGIPSNLIPAILQEASNWTGKVITTSITPMGTFNFSSTTNYIPAPRYAGLRRKRQRPISTVGARLTHLA